MSEYLKNMHAARFDDVRNFIERGIGRELTKKEFKLLDTVDEQILHLIAASIIETSR